MDAGTDRGREHLEEATVLVSCLKYLLSRWWKMGRGVREADVYIGRCGMSMRTSS